MDTLTVILHLTGLLLLTPGSTSPTATHVLIPEPPGNMERHVTRLLYRPDNLQHCPSSTHVGPFCIVELNDQDLKIGDSVEASRPPIPEGTPNVSTASSRRVPRDRYEADPSERLRSRVTFWAGERLGMCSKGWWEFRDTTMMVPNVVTYELVHTGAGLPRITVTPLRDHRPTPQLTLAAAPEARGEVHLFVYSVTPAEPEQVETIAMRRLAGAPALDNSVPLARQDPLPYRSRASHYRAYYNLIGATWWNRRTEPRFLVPVVDENHNAVKCQFSPQRASPETREIMNDLRSASSYSCLVAAGTPAQ